MMIVATWTAIGFIAGAVVGLVAGICIASMRVFGGGR